MSKVEGGGAIDPPPPLKALCNYFFFEAYRVKQRRIAENWQRSSLIFDLMVCSCRFNYYTRNVELETYFQMKKTASKLDQPDRRYTSLKSAVLNNNYRQT